EEHGGRRTAKAQPVEDGVGADEQRHRPDQPERSGQGERLQLQARASPRGWTIDRRGHFRPSRALSRRSPPAKVPGSSRQLLLGCNLRRPAGRGVRARRGVILLPVLVSLVLSASASDGTVLDIRTFQVVQQSSGKDDYYSLESGPDGPYLAARYRPPFDTMVRAIQPPH